MGELHEEPPIDGEQVTAQQVSAAGLNIVAEGREILGPIGSLGISIGAEQKRRSLVDRLLPRFKTIRAIALAASLATGVAACGSSASSANKAPTRATITTPTTLPESSTSTAPSTTTTLPPAPTKHYVALCDKTDIQYLDATTGKVIQTVPIHTDFGTFTPSIRYDSNDSSDKNPTCGQWSYNGALDKISGLDGVGYDAVPAVYNLLTGAITDLVARPNTSTSTTVPFDAPTTSPPAYVGTYFDPINEDVFWLEDMGSSQSFEVGSPSGGIVKYSPLEDCGGDTASQLGITFVTGSTTPLPGCVPVTNMPPFNNQAGSWELLPSNGEGNNDANTQDLTTRQMQFGLNFALPSSNYYWQIIRRSDDGQTAAFVGYTLTRSVTATTETETPTDCTLFTVGTSVGAPVAIERLPSCGSPAPETYQVIRYIP